MRGVIGNIISAVRDLSAHLARRGQGSATLRQLRPTLSEETALAATTECSDSALTHVFQIARRALLSRGLWSLFDARIENGNFTFRGFAIPPRDLTMPLRFFVNGMEAPVIDHPEDSGISAIAARFGLGRPETAYSFRCSMPLPETHDTLRIEFRPGAGRLLFPYQDWYVRLQPGLQAEPARRFRVARTANAMLFESMGFSACATLRRALREYFDRDFNDCTAILDWGCGCARVARFVVEIAPEKLVGIDIDADNIGWCQQNVAGAEFDAIALNPPTQLTAECFDFIYGISVFTHLSEADQDQWLAELHRLAKPGGAVMMSIHGEVAFCRGDSRFDRFLALDKDGFVVYGRCPDLDEVLPEMKDTSYYMNVFHGGNYIYEHWSRYFEIIDVLPGALNGHQDLVVMRRSP